MVHLCFTYIEYNNSALDVSVPGLMSSTVRLYTLHHIFLKKNQTTPRLELDLIPFGQQQPNVCTFYIIFRLDNNSSMLLLCIQCFCFAVFLVSLHGD